MEESQRKVIEKKATLNVKYSAVAFISGLSPLFWAFLEPEESSTSTLKHISLCSSASTILGRVMFPSHFDIWWRAQITGMGVTTGVSVISASSHLWPFGAYLCILSMFHYLEYAVTGLTNPSNLSTDSFLLNHSLQYWLAAFASWIEYFIELYFVPGLKQSSFILSFGIAVCLTGDILRKLAMFHAGKSFSHIVQSSKKDDHFLITSGVFSMMRHPSYVGWFLWSLGTQILLSNPLCFVLYTIVSWMFFNERIFMEEYCLIRFFGEDYEVYQAKVPVGIPFIKGFRVARID